VPLGVATAFYTGVLLGAMPSRPFWNSPILALLFLVSALSTGIAAILLLRMLVGKSRGDATAERPDTSGYLLTASDMMIIGLEFVIVILFVMYSQLSVGDVREAIGVIFAGGSLAIPFWIVFVAIGLILPAIMELRYVLPTLLQQRAYAIPWSAELVITGTVLIGGLALRYAVLAAGQLTGPAGLHFPVQ
jgi:formate-dependent nitrite reductase membrane component NrfD